MNMIIACDGKLYLVNEAACMELEGEPITTIIGWVKSNGILMDTKFMDLDAFILELERGK
jgi:hypothetical protein